VKAGGEGAEGEGENPLADSTAERGA